VTKKHSSLTLSQSGKKREMQKFPVSRPGYHSLHPFLGQQEFRLGLEKVAKVEAELREGQANDALEALRASLAEKSLRFRTQVKPAKGQKTMTRAWDSIHKADKQI
jgi:hypothetical protein